MAISGTLTGTEQSASFFPSNGVSDVVLDSSGCKGQIFLMVKATNTEWKVVTDQQGAFSVMTPDTSLEYAFFSQALVGTAEFFMGP